MSDNLKNILSNLSTEVDSEKLLEYLKGRLPEEQHHELEKQLLDDEFNAEALEGLQEFRDKEQLQYMVEMLNRDLKKKTEKNKKRREKMKIKDQPWLYMSILILILLLVMSYIVIKRLLGE